MYSSLLLFPATSLAVCMLCENQGIRVDMGSSYFHKVDSQGKGCMDPTQILTCQASGLRSSGFRA